LQQVQGISWEVVLVDNCSTDATQAVAMQEWGKYERSVPFKMVFEPQAGLIHARQKGMQEAAYDFFLFCDDDNRLQEDYIQHAYTTMLAQPAVAILGGRGIACCETEAPWWFERFAGNYATGEPLPSTGIASKKKNI